MDEPVPEGGFSHETKVKFILSIAIDENEIGDLEGIQYLFEP